MPRTVSSSPDPTSPQGLTAASPNLLVQIAGTLAFARGLSASLKLHFECHDAEQIRLWPIARVRDTLLWLDLQSRGLEHRGLGEFCYSRRDLRRCRRCGCTDNNACGEDRPCSWVGPDLCSACTL